jgi:hypothetical protein
MLLPLEREKLMNRAQRCPVTRAYDDLASVWKSRNAKGMLERRSFMIAVPGTSCS